jgi:putative Mg2+ transporter-C (MgtC) family protein
LTTAAGLWASACLGLAAGVGFYEAVVPAAILILLTITVFTHIESGLVSMSKNMDVLVEFDHLDDLGTVIRALKDEKAKIYDVEVNKRSISTGNASAVFSVVLSSRRRHSEIVSILADLECVESVEEI